MELPVGGRHCRRTGLVLVPAEQRVALRVAKTSYGPLNPPRRPVLADADASAWARWDTRGGRTVYLAHSAECAYSEVLAYYRRSLGQRDALSKDAEFLGLTPADLAEEVEQQWSDRGYMPPGHLARGWRAERALYTLALPAIGWWVLPEHPDSLAALETALGEELASIGVAALDVAVLRGGHREATVLLASWIRQQYLDDGSRPHGVQYQSKHATGTAWAYWLGHDDGARDPSSEPLTALGETPLEHDDPDLQHVAHRFGLKTW